MGRRGTVSGGTGGGVEEDEWIRRELVLGGRKRRERICPEG